MNIKGYESIDKILDRGVTPLSIQDFEATANEYGALMLDTRKPEDFATGFIPNSINIGLKGNFAQWVGEMIPDVKQPILLITEPGAEEEAVTRLARVGYDNTLGFLKGGFETWKVSRKEFDSVQRIDASKYEAAYNSQRPLTIDVRKKSEFDSEHVIGALNIPLNAINDRLAEFPKERSFVLQCAGGYRSMIAASILKQRGWDDFVDIEGGLSAIKNKNVEISNYVEPSTML